MTTTSQLIDITSDADFDAMLAEVERRTVKRELAEKKAARIAGESLAEDIRQKRVENPYRGRIEVLAFAMKDEESKDPFEATPEELYQWASEFQACKSHAAYNWAYTDTYTHPEIWAAAFLASTFDPSAPSIY